MPYRNNLLGAVSAVTLLLAAPAVQAVHQCGAQHHGHSNGCKKVVETDFFNGDPRADAPALAYRGQHAVGVRSMRVVNRDELDIVNMTDDPELRYDRPLKLEVWYPASLHHHQSQITTYHDVTGSGANNPDRPNRPFEFAGRAARGAAPDLSHAPYPLVILSHGYPGSRVLMTYLTENLASKGYVVVAIDHTDSTHGDAARFGSTLLNRTLDINFVLDRMARKSHRSRGYLSGLVDADNTAVIGYSMGGYGALNAVGAGYTAASVAYPWAVPHGHLARLQAGTQAYAETLDERIRAMVAFAPWGGQLGFWDPEGLAGIEVPSLFISGAQDQTSVFSAIRWLWENAINSDRYLLVFESAIHEVAVNPAPPTAELDYREYVHYQEPGWDNRRLNNVNQHFITAFLGKYLQGDTTTYEPYLALNEPISNNSHRTDEEDPSYWTGFTNWAAIGMEFHHLPPQ